MYVPRAISAGFSDMIDEYVHFNIQHVIPSHGERMTPDYMVVWNWKQNRSL